MLNELEDEEDFGENGQLLASNSSNNDMLTSEQNVPTVAISPSTTIEMSKLLFNSVSSNLTACSKYIFLKLCLTKFSFKFVADFLKV